jgi:hypothetical protein
VALDIEQIFASENNKNRKTGFSKKNEKKTDGISVKRQKMGAQTCSITTFSRMALRIIIFCTFTQHNNKKCGTQHKRNFA